MSDIHNHQGTISITEKINIFLKKTTPVFVGFLAIIIIVIAVVAGVNIVSTNQKTGVPEIAEKIESDYQSWISESDQNKKNAIENSIKKNVELLATQNAASFSYQRGLMIEGSIFFEKKEYANAVTTWNHVVDGFKDSYLSSIALQNSAVADEENGNIDKAIESYKILIEKYSKKIPGIPHALWSLGRLYEQKKDIVASKLNYQKLLEEYPNDENWTKLAESRILFMETQGLTK